MSCNAHCGCNRSFQIQEDCVTNAQFAEFVAATNYKTEAELFGLAHLLHAFARPYLLSTPHVVSICLPRPFLCLLREQLELPSRRSRLGESSERSGRTERTGPSDVSTSFPSGGTAKACKANAVLLSVLPL